MDCPHHPRCPGCPSADLAYPAQLRAKRARLIAATRLFPHLPQVNPIVGSQWTTAYRHRLKLPIQPGKRVSIGLYDPKTRRVLHTPDCPVLATKLREALPPILTWLKGKRGIHSVDLRVSQATGELQVIFACAGGDLHGGPRAARALIHHVPGLVSVAVSIADRSGRRVMGSRPRVVAGKAVIEEKIGSTTYDLLPGSFFQIDPRQAHVLHGLVADAVGDASTVLDLYAGVGAYALALAKGRKKVVAVEEVRQAAEAARRRAPRNLTVHTSKVEDLELSERFDVAILNPARRGADPVSLARLAKLTERLVYVSCGPETLARDLDILANHGLRTRSLTPIDLFPQTREVETVAVVERGPVVRGPWGSPQKGRVHRAFALVVGSFRGRLRSAKVRKLGEVATHSLLELQPSAPLSRVVQELARARHPLAGSDPKTKRFFQEKAGLMRPFLHPVHGKNAPLHGDLVLTLRALSAPERLISRCR